MICKCSVESGPGLVLATVDGETVSMMRSAQRAAASSSTSGIPARMVRMLVGKLGYEIEVVER
jgi:hypothetical protein